MNKYNVLISNILSENKAIKKDTYLFPAKKIKLAYILLEFPKISETFILEELLELNNRGHDVTIYTIRPNRENY